MDDGEPNVDRPRKDWTLAYIVVAAIGVVALLALFTSPVAALLGDSSYAIPSALHGVSAIVYVIVATVAAYLGYRMYIGRLDELHDLRILASLNAFFSLITILFGNWIYIAYRAESGPRTYFLENNPVVHEIFFEFKEFIALFTLPLAVAAAFILLRHRDELLKHSRLRLAVAVALGLSWLFLMLAFGLGAAITKLRSV
jgi:cytochrome bd-type quinol oxidase subunit 1